MGLGLGLGLAFKQFLMQVAVADKRDEAFVEVVIGLLKSVEITETEHIQGVYEDYIFTGAVSGAKQTFMKKLFDQFAPKVTKDPYSTEACSAARCANC